MDWRLSTDRIVYIIRLRFILLLDTLSGASLEVYSPLARFFYKKISHRSDSDVRYAELLKIFSPMTILALACVS